MASSFSVEVVMHMLEMCSYETLIAASQVSRGMRAVVFKIIRFRVGYFVKLFVPPLKERQFFELFENTDACIAGGVVRCMISIDRFRHFAGVNPLQINIIVPKSPSDAHASRQRFRMWKRFIYTCGYSEDENSDSNPPATMRASCSRWSLMKMGAGGDRRFSLIESESSSVYPPIFQSSQTSTFYLLSSTRIYTLYPKLHSHEFNLSLRAKGYNEVFDCFNYGLLTFRSSEDWDAFSGTCGNACPSIRRHTKEFPGWRVFRWGGKDRLLDVGNTVSLADPYGKKDYSWKLPGECSKSDCENFVVTVDVFEEAC